MTTFHPDRLRRLPRHLCLTVRRREDSPAWGGARATLMCTGGWIPIRAGLRDGNYMELSSLWAGLPPSYLVAAADAVVRSSFRR